MKDGCNGLCSRRHFLGANTMGIGSLALAWLLKQDNLLAGPVKPDLEARTFDLLPKKPHFEAKAKAMISLFMIGGPSQMDLFDYKPEMAKYDGKPFPGEIKYDNQAEASSKVFATPWAFKQHGQSGQWVSELLPHTAGVIDDICVIKSMHTGVNNHGQSMYALASGRTTAGRPTVGSWLTYGLGSESQELPAYVALTHPNGAPLLAGHNWTNGWLPSLYQGTVVRPKEPRILNLDASEQFRGAPQEKQLSFLKELNEGHKSEHRGELDLDARIASYELAAKMQTAAKEALDISNESDAIKKLYGIDEEITRDYGTRCLIARRLVERGVRFVQVINNGQSWDHHGGIWKELPNVCVRQDKPVAALLKDLKSRGLLDSTLVHWGGEMGRLPVLQNDLGKDKMGRDHNTYGFTQWLAGGGVKGGLSFGETDEWSHHAVKDIVNHYDYHATVLHLFGIDHKKLSFKRNGQELTLVDNQPARVVKEILA
jgi:hypothetical protein